MYITASTVISLQYVFPTSFYKRITLYYTYVSYDKNYKLTKKKQHPYFFWTLQDIPQNVVIPPFNILAVINFSTIAVIYIQIHFLIAASSLP